VSLLDTIFDSCVSLAVASSAYRPTKPRYRRTVLLVLLYCMTMSNKQIEYHHAYRHTRAEFLPNASLMHTGMLQDKVVWVNCGCRGSTFSDCATGEQSCCGMESAWSVRRYAYPLEYYLINSYVTINRRFFKTSSLYPTHPSETVRIILCLFICIRLGA
jgi:hypothetical protein